MKKISIIFLLATLLLVQICAAEENDSLKQSIKSANSIEEAEPQLKELLDVYSAEKEFDEFYTFLTSLEKNRNLASSPLIYYYKTLTRINQMQFLEENKMWEELFDNKNLYEPQIKEDLEKARKSSVSIDALSLKLKFIEWQLIKDDEGASITTLEELFNLAQEYAQTQGAAIVIKDIADELSQKKEDNYAKKLYNVYVSKIAETDIGQKELKELAEAFIIADRVNVAIALYDIYLDKLADSQLDRAVVLEEMFEIAEKFVHPGWQDGLDPFYAEEVYKRIEFLLGEEAFTDLSRNKRSYNLERIKEHDPCLGEYLELADSFPEYLKRDNVYFRLGIISAYLSSKIDKARGYFLKIINDYPESQDYLNSLYHLGLLSHWQEDSEKAKEYYNKIIEKTKGVEPGPEIATLAKSRAEEIEEVRDIEYNLRTFLDAVLIEGEEEKYVQLELYAKFAKEYLEEPIEFQTNSYSINTGCLQQDLTYLWSGQLGDNQAPFNKSEFHTSYFELGTKVVNVVLVGQSGALVGTVEMADIHPLEAENKE
ncbi:tol-pal system YbgF family protein [Candidatus Omnitrophota bacterium]